MQSDRSYLFDFAVSTVINNAIIHAINNNRCNTHAKCRLRRCCRVYRILRESGSIHTDLFFGILAGVDMT
jgi:hypothetical protein